MAAKSIGTNIYVFGAEPEMVNDTYRSFYHREQQDDDDTRLGHYQRKASTSSSSPTLSPQGSLSLSKVTAAVADHHQRCLEQRQCNLVGATSVADGLLTNVGELTFPVLMSHVDGVYTVTEKQIVDAMYLVWSRVKLCIEPSAAVSLAVALYNRDFHRMVREKHLKRIGLVLSGGNVDHARAVSLFEKYQVNGTGDM